MIDKIVVAPYKQHQGQGDQISYKGIPLAKVEQAVLEKLHEVIDHINKADCCAEVVEARSEDEDKELSN